jgi:hypothetical protein
MSGVKMVHRNGEVFNNARDGLIQVHHLYTTAGTGPLFMIDLAHVLRNTGVAHSYERRGEKPALLVRSRWGICGVDSDKQQPLDLLASSDCLSATTSANLHGFNLFNDTIGGQNLKFGSLNGICP